MSYNLEEKYKLIKEELKKSKSKNPIAIVKSIMHRDFINIHGPEHHFLDGGAFLVAYSNSNGDINLDKALDELAIRTIKMPGAMCGLWGICGSCASVGAALSIIHETGPLSSDRFYKEHMEFTSKVISKMSEIGGPRCCKRNAFLSISEAIRFINDHYGIEMEQENIVCEFTDFNKECLKKSCPFFKGNIVILKKEDSNNSAKQIDKADISKIYKSIKEVVNTSLDDCITIPRK